MLEWFRETFETGPQPELDVVIARPFLAALLGGAAGAIYAWTHRRDETFAINFVTTLVLLSILLSTVTQVIGDSLARAFGLVGVLAIVRFRTVVEDTRDTAFVILAVILGMAVGAGSPRLAVAALGFAAATAIVLQPRRDAPLVNHWTLKVRMAAPHKAPVTDVATLKDAVATRDLAASADPETLMEPLFAKYLESYHFLSTGTARQGTAIELAWSVRLRVGVTAVAFVAELNRVEGMQDVELRQAKA